MRILIGLSGGLDSTFAACLLRDAGHEVVGCALRMHRHTPIADAEIAAGQAGIPLVVLDCEQAFEREVVAPFLLDYTRARTPNPCVRCNRYVKIESLCRYAEENGFDCVATGHYASVLRDGQTGRYFVRRAESQKKDQSYVLWGLSQRQLSMLYLPLAGQDKAEIRAEALRLGLYAAQSKESMENCFIPEGSYAEFLSSRGKVFEPGDFLDQSGAKVGEHRGIVHYTIGQRKGLGIAMGRPVFVTAIDPELHTVTLGDEPDLYSSRAVISDLVFQKRSPAPGSFRAEVKIRYAAPPERATITVLPDLHSAEICFDRPVRAVTPGQSAVAYEGNDLLLGGVFDSPAPRA